VIRRPRLPAVVLVVLLLLLVMGCGTETDTGLSPDDGPATSATGDQGRPLTVPEALAADPGSQVTVAGTIIQAGGELLLAELLAESFPPQAGGAVLVVVGVTIDDFAPVNTEGDTSWVDASQTLQGSIEGETLTVADLGTGSGSGSGSGGSNDTEGD